MAYHVRTAVFEGPIDLLLQLITRRQVEVTSVSLTDLVAEYLDFLEEMRGLDLDVTSEFLLIAATLVHLKARRLLPDDAPLDVSEELELIEERDRLLTLLLTAVTFKDVAAVFDARLRAANRFVARTGGMDRPATVRPPSVLVPVDAAGLGRIAAAALAVPAEPALDHLDLDLPSVQSALDELRARVGEDVHTTFSSLVEHCTRPVEVAAYFLALLELARWGLVEVSQESWLDEIEVRRRDDAGGGRLLSEWGS